jgi:hypothetical protein
LNEDKGENTSFSTKPKPPSGDAGRVFCTFGLVLSCRYADVEPIVDAIAKIGAKIIYRIPSTGQLFVLRRYEVEKVLKGELSELREIYDRKMKGEKGDEVRNDESRRNRPSNAETTRR